MGEGIIKTLRPLAPNGLKEGWSKTVIQNYYWRDVITHLKSHYFVGANEISKNDNLDIFIKSFTRYGTKEKIVHLINHNKALSVLFFRDIKTNETVIGCMISQFCQWYYCVLDIYGVLDPIQDQNGYTYFNTVLSSKEYTTKDKTKNMLNSEELSFWSVGIALPCYWSTNGAKLYCFLNEDGYSLNSSYNWSIIS